MLSSFVGLFLLSASIISNIVAQSTQADISSARTRAECALVGLQRWYNTTTGIWDTAGWWNSANIMTAIGNLAQADPYNLGVQALTRTIFADALHHATLKNPQPGIEDGNMTFAQANNTGKRTGYDKYTDPKTHQPYTVGWYNSLAPESLGDVIHPPQSNKDSDVDIIKADPHRWLDGFYDDDLWWALAWVNAFDVTKSTRYLHLAEGIFHAVARTWGTRCFKGGIWWSWKEDYMNAIANELFMSTAAHLANRVNPHKKWLYVNWAEKSLDWFLNSGLINEDWTINDGLTDACENNNGVRYSVYTRGSRSC